MGNTLIPPGRLRHTQIVVWSGGCASPGAALVAVEGVVLGGDADGAPVEGVAVEVPPGAVVVGDGGRPEGTGGVEVDVAAAGEVGEADAGGEVVAVGVDGFGVALAVGLGVGLGVAVGEGVEVGVVVGHGGLPSVISYAPGCSRRYVWYCSSLAKDASGTTTPWSQIAALQAAAGRGGGGEDEGQAESQPRPGEGAGAGRGMLSAGIGRWLLSVLSPGGGGYDTIVRAQS
jgi:hypothetical protein